MVMVTCPPDSVPVRVGAAGRPEKSTGAAVCSGGVHGVTERGGGVTPASQKGQEGRAAAAAEADGPAALAASRGPRATVAAPAAAVAASQYRARWVRKLTLFAPSSVRGRSGPPLGRSDPGGSDGQERRRRRDVCVARPKRIRALRLRGLCPAPDGPR